MITLSAIQEAMEQVEKYDHAACVCLNPKQYQELLADVRSTCIFDWRLAEEPIASLISVLGMELIVSELVVDPVILTARYYQELLEGGWKLGI